MDAVVANMKRQPYSEDRKVTKIGNSLGVTMTEAFKILGIAMGDIVNVNVKGDEIIIKKNSKVEIPEGISPDFFDMLGEVMHEYDETLKGLKDR